MTDYEADVEAHMPAIVGELRRSRGILTALVSSPEGRALALLDHPDARIAAEVELYYDTAEDEMNEYAADEEPMDPATVMAIQEATWRADNAAVRKAVEVWMAPRIDGMLRLTPHAVTRVHSITAHGKEVELSALSADDLAILDEDA
jgi:hypothetical protein